VQSAVRALCASSGLASAERPGGVFLFLGPTGTGKSHLPRVLARLMHGDAGGDLEPRLHAGERRAR